MNPETRNLTVERLLYIALFMIFFGLGIAIFLLYAQLMYQTKITNEIHQAVIELKQDKAARDKEVLDHINCIALFLAQRNRSEVQLEDIENCKITRTPDTLGPSSSPANDSSPRAVSNTPTNTSGASGASGGPTSTPTPTPTPPANVFERILERIRKLL